MRRYGGGPTDRLTKIVSALRLAGRRAERESAELMLHNVCGEASKNMAAELQWLADKIQELEDEAREIHGALGKREELHNGEATD